MKSRATYNFAVAIALGLGTVLSVAASVSASRIPASTASTIYLGTIRVTPAYVRDIDTAVVNNGTVSLGTIYVRPVHAERYAARQESRAGTVDLGVIQVHHARVVGVAGTLMAERHAVAKGVLVFGRTGG
jgi:hypothetical protein